MRGRGQAAETEDEAAHRRRAAARPKADREGARVADRGWTRDDEGGFALVEVLIALALLVSVTLVASSGSVVSTAVASGAKQQSVASALAAEAVAAAEALPISDLQAGLNPSAESLTADTNITKSGSTYTLALTGATLATSNSSTSEAPLVPHVSLVTNGIQYKVATYPSTSSTGLVTLVVIVSWSSTLNHTTRRIVAETQVAAP